MPNVISQDNDFGVFIGGPLAGSLTANTASLASGGIAWTVRQGEQVLVPMRILVNAKLYDSTPDQLPGATQLLVYHRVPGIDDQPLGNFHYQPYYDVAAGNQGSSLYQAQLFQTLTRAAIVKGGEAIVVKLNGTAVLDPTQANTLSLLKLQRRVVG